MKCPICNAENAPDATACTECGFGITLSQPEWPEPPSVPHIEPSEEAIWPEPPPIEVPDTTSLSSWADAESPGARFQEQAFSLVEPPAAPVFSQDDQLAEMHLERGKEAIQEGLLDQARWEFRQARDVADDEQIVERAQEYLRQLRQTETSTADGPPAQQAMQLPRPSAPTVGPETMRLGVGLALLNGVFTGLGAAACLGLLFSPFFGFLAGRSTIRRATNQGRSASLASAGVVGVVVGMGGWLGEMVGHPIWMSVSADVAPVLTNSLFSSCFLGILYLLLSVLFSFIGGVVGRKER